MSTTVSFDVFDGDKSHDQLDPVDSVRQHQHCAPAPRTVLAIGCWKTGEVSAQVHHGRVMVGVGCYEGKTTFAHIELLCEAPPHASHDGSSGNGLARFAVPCTQSPNSWLSHSTISSTRPTARSPSISGFAIPAFA
jgi:hypothetical protein